MAGGSNESCSAIGQAGHGGRVLWDPFAVAAWWVPRASDCRLQCHPLVKRTHELPANMPSAGGAAVPMPGTSSSSSCIWELPQTAAAPPASSYAFLVEWVQELEHSGGFTRFGSAADVGDLSASQAGAETSPAQTGCSDAGEDGELQKGEASCSEPPEDSTPDETDVKFVEHLGSAEMAFVVDELAGFATEAHGVRLSLLQSSAVCVRAVEARFADGQRAVRFKKAQHTRSVLTLGVPNVWICELPDVSPEELSGLQLRVTRRDWRLDPFAISLKRETSSESLAPFDAEGRDIDAPAGPRVWNVSMPSWTQPTPFTRCADRELVIYQLHIGSFTLAGTIAEAAAHLQHIRALGCSAVSILPIHQDANRLANGRTDTWGFDILSLFAVDSVLGTPSDVVAFIQQAHNLGLAVIADFVLSHLDDSAARLLGPHFFVRGEAGFGKRLDFDRPEVCRYVLAAAKFCLFELGFDGLRVDSTQAVRSLPEGGSDPAGGLFLYDLIRLCRRGGKLALAPDLEDEVGVLQTAGMGFHQQWDSNFFSSVYDALVNPMDEHRDLGRIAKHIVGPAAGRGHNLRGRILFLESHDSAAGDRYGRLPAAVHNGGAFFPYEGYEAGCPPYPTTREVEDNAYAARRAAIGMVLLFTAPGVPMLLQGQELFDSRQFRWPNGPAMDWQRLVGSDGSEDNLRAKSWQQLCVQLAAARSQRSCKASASLPALQGDGVHVFCCDHGVLAYLRWSEPTGGAGSIAEGRQLGLVVVNFTHAAFGHYAMGVPPSKRWRLAVNSATVASIADGEELSASSDVYEVQLRDNRHCFPCYIDIQLPAYAAMLFFCDA
eukprot:TRINITY_DN51918_c0_g1_i1.p1 TRINITY_DN51918_c0_g1~~TRINITY_DN51918_c0_g1_i1.p1  ORF type:complete len:830 (+),score=140.83 TRINITY_DN51918_c0_g1_i1:65-2554(+)